MATQTEYTVLSSLAVSPPSSISDGTERVTLTYEHCSLDIDGKITRAVTMRTATRPGGVGPLQVWGSHAMYGYELRLTQRSTKDEVDMLILGVWRAVYGTESGQA